MGSEELYGVGASTPKRSDQVKVENLNFSGITPTLGALLGLVPFLRPPFNSPWMTSMMSMFSDLCICTFSNFFQVW